MQIVFQPEELWGAKAKIKDQKKPSQKFFLFVFPTLFFFSNFINMVIGVLNTTKTWRKRGTTRKTQIQIPLEYGGVSFARNFHVYNWREMCTKEKRILAVWATRSVVLATRSTARSGLDNKWCYMFRAAVACGSCIHFPAMLAQAKHWDFLVGTEGGGQVNKWSKVKWQRVQKVKVHEV